MFDIKKPHGQILTLGQPCKYVQNGKVYNNQFNELGDDPNAETQAAADQLMEAEQRAKDEAETVQVLAAEKRLGDLGDAPEFVDPSAEANRENAAALQAETAAE